MIENIDLTDSEIKKVLKYYVPSKWHDLNDWDIILLRCEEVEDNIFLFKCSFLDLYFDNEMNILEYDNISFYKGKVYYDISGVKGFERYFGDFCLGEIDYK